MGELKPEPWREIDQSSSTWKAILRFYEEQNATACGTIANPGASMVQIRVAQGSKQTLDALMSLIVPPRIPEILPEIYPTGGHDE